MLLFALPMFARMQVTTEELTLTAGEPFTFGISTATSDSSYSWVLSRHQQILETQANRFFRGILAEPGTAELMLTVRSPAGTEESFAIPVRSLPPISITPTDQNVVRAIVRTEPPAIGSDRRVSLPQAGGTLLLYADESTGSIREYRIDVDTRMDSDGDKVPDNDADNRIHPSFIDGSAFLMSLVPSPGEMDRTVQLRVFGSQGEVSDARITIHFDPSLTLTPALATLPPIDVLRHAVILPESGGMVQLDASGTSGGASRYSLDLDLTRDTSGDSDPTNDDDTSGTAFERSGEELILFFPANGTNERRVGLTVEDRSGNRKQTTVTLLFGENAVPSIPPSSEGSLPTITSDTPVLRVGTEFSLIVEHAPVLTSVFVWDLQGDGTPDTETTTPTLLLRPDAPGMLPVNVTFRDAAGGVLGTAQATFTVNTPGTEGTGETGEELPTDSSVRIDITEENDSITFRPVGENNLPLASLYATWEFGDRTKSYLRTPTHTYGEAGEYEVTLTLTDIATGRVIATAKSNVTAKGITDTPEVRTSGVFAGLFRTFRFMFRVMLFVLILLILLSTGGLIFFAIAARREGITLRAKLIAYREGLHRGFDGREESARVPEILEAASLPRRAGTEPPPMKLVPEEVTKKAEVPKSVPPPPSAPAVSKPPPPPPPPPKPTPVPPPNVPKIEVSKKQEPAQSASPAEATKLPAWLVQGDQTPSVTPQSSPKGEASRAPKAHSSPPPLKPATPPPPSSAPPPPPSAPAANVPMPAWLATGIEKGKVEPVKNLPPPPAPKVALPSGTPPAPPQVAPKEGEILPDDAQVATLRAELPKEENKGEESQGEKPIPKDEPGGGDHPKNA